LVYYLGLIAIAGLLNHIVAWNENVLAPGDINWYFAFSAFFLAFYLFEIDFLFRVTQDTLVEFRSILELPAVEFERIAFKFTHLPARATSVVFTLGTSIGLILGWYIFPTAQEMNPAFSEMELPIFSLSFGVGYVATYMVIRAFVLINRVYEGLESINVYDLDTLYPLSKYSAWLIVFVILYV